MSKKKVHIQNPKKSGQWTPICDEEGTHETISLDWHHANCKKCIKTVIEKLKKTAKKRKK